MSIDIFQVQCQRLKRHYLSSLNGYDEVSLLDLASALRYFTEIPKWIDANYRPKISDAKFDAGMEKILRGAEFAHCYLPPDGVTILGKMGPNGLFEFCGPIDGAYSLGGMVKIDADQRISIKEFFLIYRDLPASEMALLNTYSQNLRSSGVGLNDYLNAIAVRFQFSGESPRFISRSDLIKRIANEHDASHSSFADKPDGYQNGLSSPVKRLMEYSCAELPLPFFVLLHTTKSILVSLKIKID